MEIIDLHGDKLTPEINIVADDQKPREILAIVIGGLMLAEQCNDGTLPGAAASVKSLEFIKELVVRGDLPSDLYGTIHRLCGSYMGEAHLQSLAKGKKARLSEKEMQLSILNEWENSVLADLFFVSQEHVLPDGDRVDILANDKTGRPVIVELKRGKKDGYKQLCTYGRHFDSPRLINVSQEPVISKKHGIEYRVFAAPHPRGERGIPCHTS